MKQAVAASMLGALCALLPAQTGAYGEPEPAGTRAPEPREMRPPPRFAEFGIDVSASAANNLLGFSALFPAGGVILLDLPRIAERLKELDFGSAFSAGLSFSLNAGRFLRVGTASTLYGGGSLAFGHDLLEALAHGNAGGGASGTAKAYGSVFADTSLSATHFFAPPAPFKAVGVRLTPSVFFPLLYVEPGSGASFEVVSDDGTGKLAANGEYDISVYTPFSLENPDRANVFSAPGADFSLYAEYPLREDLCVALTLAHIPLKAAMLDYKTHFSGTFSMPPRDLLQEGLPSLDDLHSASETEYGDAHKKVYRPFKMSAEAAYRPGGKWLSLYPALGFAADTPFYFEYRLAANARLPAGWVDFTAASNCTDRAFAQELGVRFNLRVFELSLAVSSRSQDFLRSFALHGLGASLGIRAGSPLPEYK